jgi:hypothetical protein
MGRDLKPLDQLAPSAVTHHKGALIARLKSPKIKGSLGFPPKWMSAEEKKIWRALAKAAPGQLGENDRTMMEITCVLKAKLEARTITGAELGTLIRCLKDLGLIIKDRKPVDEVTPEKDELDDLGI